MVLLRAVLGIAIFGFDFATDTTTLERQSATAIVDGGTNVKHYVIAVIGLFIATMAQAQAIPRVLPEPGTLELLSLGGVVAAVIAIRNRRKK